MKSMFRRVVSLLITVTFVLTLVLTGCGNKSAQLNEEPKKTENSKSVETKGEVAKNVIGQNVKFDPNTKANGKLVFWTCPEADAYVKPIIDEYKELRSDVELEVVESPWSDYWKKLPIAIQSGNGPDVYFFHNMYHDLMVGGNMMEPYPKDLVDNLKKDYLYVETHEFDGKVYYIDTGVGHGVIYYNKALWKEAGFTENDFPKTWEDLRDKAIKLTKRNGDKITVAGFNMNPVIDFVKDWQLLSGRFLFSEDGKKVLFNNPDFEKTVKFFKDLYSVDKVSSTTFPEYLQSFQDGTTAMIWQHPWFANSMINAGAKVDFGVFPQPMFKDAKRNWHYSNGDSSFGVNPKSTVEAKKLAFDFLTLFFSEDKLMENWDLKQTLSPSKKSLLNSQTLLNNPVLNTVMKDAKNSLFLGAVPYDQYVTVLQNYLIDPVFKADKPIDEAIKEAEAKCNDELAKLNFKPFERVSSFSSELK